MPFTWFRHTLIPLLLLTVSSEAVYAGDAIVSIRDFMVDPPTIRCLGFRWYINGDDNGDAGVVPVLLFCPDSGEPERFPGCTVYNNAFDLRLLDSDLAGMLAAPSPIP